jgi:hypothetical protein
LREFGLKFVETHFRIEMPKKKHLSFKH